MEEHLTVGHLAVDNEDEVMLTPSFVWAVFQPISDRYRLPLKMPSEGRAFKCPKCEGHLCVRVLEVEPEDIRQKRAQLKQKIVAQYANDKHVMVRGKTYKVAETRHVDGLKQPIDLAPITLGKTKVQAVG